MTLPYERTAALVFTRKFLLKLCDRMNYPGTPKEVRQDARALLRHYPSDADINTTVNGFNDKLVSFVLECPLAKVQDDKHN